MVKAPRRGAAKASPPPDAPVETLAGKTVYVIDAHSLIFQVFHAMPESMTSPTGQPTGAIHGFIRDIFDVLETQEETMEGAMMRIQTHDRIRTLVDQLPEEQREVVILRHYADMSFKEIAGLTRVSINTALGRMRYALINIRKMIEQNQLQLQ